MWGGRGGAGGRRRGRERMRAHARYTPTCPYAVVLTSPVNCRRDCWKPHSPRLPSREAALLPPPLFYDLRNRGFLKSRTCATVPPPRAPLNRSRRDFQEERENGRQTGERPSTIGDGWRFLFRPPRSPICARSYFLK